MLHCALLTPGGVGAIAVILLRGAGARELLEAHLVSASGSRATCPAAGHLRFAQFIHDGETLDEVIVAPAAGSGEAYEICCHGGARVVQRMLAIFAERGAALDASGTAWSGDAPGWQGALHRRLHACLVQAETQRGVRFLLAQRDVLPGAISEILELARRDLDAARSALRDLIDRSRGAWYRWRGATIVVVGAANAGKSSLMNRLAGREGAVVTARAGTTRDWVTAETAIAGVPVRLVDTAGRRTTSDPLERAAIDAGRAQRVVADLVVHVIDGSTQRGRELTAMEVDELREAHLVVVNKQDLPADSSVGAALGHLLHLSVSALTGAGIPALREAILERMGLGEAVDRSPAIFDERLCACLVDLPDEGRLDADAWVEHVQQAFVRGCQARN